MRHRVGRKRNHDFATVKDATRFCEMFARETGLQVMRAVEQYVRPGAARCVLLTGSIPLGIGSAASDIDLLVAVESAGDLQQVRPPSRATFVANAADAGLVLADFVMAINGIEVDMQIASLSALGVLCQRVCAGGLRMSYEELSILSRMGTGWVLYGDASECVPNWHFPWRQSLRTHAATRAYVLALKNLEDAVAATEDNHLLALHLGRLAVEHAIRAYLASRGHVTPSSKWLRLCERLRQTAAGEDAQGIAAVMRGVDLLFPHHEGAGTGLTYVNSVAKLLTAIRKHIEKDAELALAFRISSHVYELR